MNLETMKRFTNRTEQATNVYEIFNIWDFNSVLFFIWIFCSILNSFLGKFADETNAKKFPFSRNIVIACI